ncbi:disulfide bond formation protein B [Candidatus Nomurabacteria bacterium]|nr:disulfide bond formation protein B [Candidatus Nomurabacteria bacterium]MCB9819125.1 disulfide bond formation protein B [Candidatus Nomurabacteria bacterium]
MYLLPTLNFVLAVGGLALGALTIALYVDYFIYKGKYFQDRVKEAMWPVVTLTTIGTVALTLLYSEYFKFIPCSLCWLQRIAIYPQALLVLLAFRNQDTRNFPLYGIGLSIFGLIVAIYQYIYQLVPPAVREGGFAPCLIDGSNADCAVKVINEFGFVTFPLLSAITFAFLIVVYLYMRRN